MRQPSYPVGPVRVEHPPSRVILVGLVLSLLFHALLVWLLQQEDWLDFLKPKPPAPPMEMAMIIPPPPPPPRPQPEPQAQPLPPPPEPPQLKAAPLAEKSTAPAPRNAPIRRSEPAPPVARAPEPLPGPAVRPVPPVPVAPADMAAAVQRAPEMAQSEQDFFLRQIVTNWIIDLDAPQFRDIAVGGSYVVLPNGMLAPPFGKNDPWDMRRMVRDWDLIVSTREAQHFRTAAETFLRAMRLSQPLQLPPDFGPNPKRMTLNFRISDIQ